MEISIKNTLLIICLIYNISTLKCDTLQQYSTPHTKEFCTTDSCVFIVQDDNPAIKYAQEYNEIMNNILDAEENYQPCYYKNCSCFLETIINDLRPYENGISKQLIDDVAERGTKFQIINHTLYRDKDCLFPSRCNGIQYFLTQILKDLPDMEMIINCRDWPQISRLLGRKGPVFSFSRTRDYLDIMYPAWSFWEGGPAISLYPTGIGRWDKHRQTIKEAGERWYWESKESMAFFRGSRTSDERDALVLLSRQNPELVYAQYTKNQAWESPKDTLNEAPAAEISLEDHCQYKYLFNYRGIAASFRFKHLFLCKSLVFHVGDEYQEFFYRLLKPWVHYVPVEKNASQNDILNLIKFFHHHDDLAKRIAENGFDLIWNHLKMDDVSCYWRELLKRYAKLLKFTVTLDPKLIKISNNHQ